MKIQALARTRDLNAIPGLQRVELACVPTHRSVLPVQPPAAIVSRELMPTLPSSLTSWPPKDQISSRYDAKTLPRPTIAHTLHSEYSSPTDRTHLLQIWILPEKQNLQPGYEQVLETMAELWEHHLHVPASGEVGPFPAGMTRRWPV